jgi:hypothetical protein
MGWLQYSDDEVARFHPAFEDAGREVLSRLGQAGADLEWLHHPGGALGIVPDFVLVQRSTGRWLLVVEVKRSRSAVFSARFQAQAKSYADNNRARFRPGRPVYFAITNLEVTVLFAAEGARPAAECTVSGGITESGDFSADPEAAHRERYIQDLGQIVERVLATQRETFEVVWPPLARLWLQHADELARLGGLGLPHPPSPSWETVSEYFGQSPEYAAARVTLLQGLLVDFLRGRLLGDGHPRAGHLPAQNGGRADIARAIDALRAIDFDAIFDQDASGRFRDASGQVRAAMDLFARELVSQTSPSLAGLAQERQDFISLLEQALLAVYPIQDRAARGKVQTDPELAQVLAALTIDGVDTAVDPCSGDGPLLVAALDRLIAMGADPADAIRLVRGIEADPVSARLTAARLSLRAASTLDSDHQPVVLNDDMFAHPQELADARSVLMNPPFRRYEDQGGTPPPPGLLAHYREAIERLGGEPPESLGGQPNLFHYYVEFVARATAPGTRIGFVLDNKWFHNRSGNELRRVVLERFRILALVEYPHRAFFRPWDIATSLLIAVRDDQPAERHEVRFVRARTDPRSADLGALADAIAGNGPWPSDWVERRVRQGSLDPGEGWKREFASPLAVDLASLGLRRLEDAFEWSRRGSLEKEGGGTAILGLPFDRTNYGPRRRPGAGASGPGYGTRSGRSLTSSENDQLRALAARIPDEFRGRALKRSDHLRSYEISAADAERVQILEPPTLRRHPELFEGRNRARWGDEFQAALDELREEPSTAAYLQAVEQVVGLTTEVLPDEKRFVDLREPYAGELVIPRKTRVGHRVHVNPSYARSTERQIRLSSNFLTYGGCVFVDQSEGIDRLEATRLIAAFLVSSFGQLQFELAGANREGLLALEKDQVDEVLIIDPRDLEPGLRRGILDEFARLRFPVMNDVPARDQQRVGLDRLFADALAPRAGMTGVALLDAIHDAVDEWVYARQP